MTKYFIQHPYQQSNCKIILMSRLKQAQKLKLNLSQNQPVKVQPQKVLTTTQKAKNILLTVQQKLMHDLDDQTIIIPIKQIPFQKDQNNKKQFQDQEFAKLQKIIQEKQQIRKRLNQVQKSQRLLQAGLDTNTVRQRSTFSMRPKSQLSNQDIEKLKSLKRDQIKFEEELDRKTKIYEENLKRHRQEERKLQQMQMKQTNQKKKMQIKKRLQQLTRRQMQRAQKFEQDKANIAKIKVQKRLHEQVAQKWEKAQNQQSQRKKKQLQQRKKQKSVDFSQLKQHERKYEQIMRKNRDQMSKKRLQASRLNNKLFKSRIHQSKFYTLIVQDQQKRKNQDNERRQVIVQLIERKKEFAEIVKRNYAPKAKVKSQQSQQQQKKKSQIKRTVLDPEQFRRKGLSYLEEAKSRGNKSAIQKQKQRSLQLQNETVSQTKTKYHDYLTEYRRNREKSDQKSVKYEKNFKIDVQQAKNIMKKTSFSEKQKIQRVKMLAQRMQFDPKTSKSSTLLKKIQAKIEILQALQ